MKNKNVPITAVVGSRGGFTLVELLAVMAIIGILAGMVLGITKIATGKAATARALSDMELIKNELQAWKLKYGAFPEAGVSDGMDVEMDGRFPFDDDVWMKDEIKDYSFIDPWGTSYLYVRHSKHQCEVWSKGPDARANTEDDLPENRGVN